MIRTLAILFCLSSTLTFGNPQYLDAEIEVLDKSALEVIKDDLKVEILSDTLGWAEGPTWSTELNALLFSDIQENKVMKWSEAEGLTTYLFPSGHKPDGINGKWRGSNGLLINKQGQLLIAQQGGRTLARMNASLTSPKSDFDILASKFEGKQLNSPNDLVLHTNGNLYFTDPPYGLDGFENSPAVELSFFGVFTMRPNGELTVFDDALKKPNGIALSPDQSTLYVSDSELGTQTIWQYKLDKNGNRLSKQVFFDATQHVTAEEPGGTDGVKIHQSGNVIATMPGGIGVISPKGKLLAKVKFGQTTNLALDAAQNFLYITAPQKLLRIGLVNNG